MTFPTDAEGYVHLLNYDRPGLGHEIDWDFVSANREMVDSNQSIVP